VLILDKVHPGSPWVTPRRGEGASACSGAGQPHGTRRGRRGPGRFWSGHPSQGAGVSSTGSDPTNDRDPRRLVHRGYPKM